MLWQNRCSINKFPLPRRRGATHCKALIYKEGQHNFFRTHHGDGTGVCFCPIVVVYFSFFNVYICLALILQCPRGLIRASRSFQDPSPHRKESEIGKSKLESLASGRKYRGGFRLGSKRKGAGFAFAVRSAPSASGNYQTLRSWDLRDGRSRSKK